jgi:hypothetical protein
MSVILGSTGITFPDATTQTTAAASSGINVQTFTSSGTWTKPSLAAGSRVFIQAWGGGGSGGRYSGQFGGGGGGGGYNERWLTLSSMGATETVTIGAGGTAISTNAAGNIGGTTTVGSLISAYGGGGGGSDGSINAGGGGGGGQLSAGTSAVSYTSGISGSPWGQISQFNSGFTNGGLGSSTSTFTNYQSVWGGGGGGASSGGISGGTSSFGGNGGAGSYGANGTAGSQPGGGGGGTGAALSGAGGAGQVIITVFPA